MSSRPNESVILRDVRDEDLDVVFEMNREPESVWQAAFGPEDPNDRAAFDARWHRIRDGAGMARVIEHAGTCAGTLMCWAQEGRRYLGYWVERSHRGRGVASTALAQFIPTVEERPLWAWVAEDNIASQRVLERCGFQVVDREVGYSTVRGADVAELLYTLTSNEEL